MNDILRNVLIQPKVVSKEGIDFLVNHAKNAPKDKMGVFDGEKANQNKEGHPSRVDLSVRNVDCSDTSKIIKEITELYNNIVHHVINPFYEFKIRDSESPQLLIYEPEGHYKSHYDAVSRWKNPDGSIIWKKSVDRDLSTILFLNDDFEGGEFVFPDLRVRIKPEPGLLVAFPSSQFYLHKVEPVISGTRFAMVNWMTVQGMPTKAEIDKEIEDKYNINVY